MSVNALFSEEVALLVCDLVANASTVQDTGYVDCSKYNRLAIVVHPVSLGGALDVDIEQATDTSGTGAKTFDSGGKDVTVLQTDTKPSIIEINADEFDVAGGFDCLNVEVTPGGASYWATVIYGKDSRYEPVPTTNWDAVTN